MIADATIEARIEHHGQRMTECADERPLRAVLHCVACVAWAGVGYASGFWHRAAEREAARQSRVRSVITDVPAGAVVSMHKGSVVTQWRVPAQGEKGRN